jgi:hypothetical protein
VIYAIDIDIGRITIVSSAGAVHQVKDPWDVRPLIDCGSIVLLEVAAPVFYHGDGKAAFTSTARWMIWNALAAGMIYQSLCSTRAVQAAPSSVWTMGYDEPTRHELAGMKPVSFKTYTRKGKKVVSPVYSREDGNHDVRECRAMLWSYGVKPSLWEPFCCYLGSI